MSNNNTFLRRSLLGAVVMACLPFVQLTAQENAATPPPFCGHEHYLQQLLEQHPEMQQQIAATEQHTQRYLEQLEQHPTTKRAVYTIPVVFHVVYNTTAENISDAQIQSQITALNRDFRKQNADAATIPSAFATLAADAEIEFCLAQRDPSNNVTTGITRTFTNTTTFSTNGNVFSSATGGKDIWDRSKYLNIYICDLTNGLGGYAQLPNGPAATDGVVIDYAYVGTTSNVPYPYDEGRTAVHEVGHWLNLLHIWGDSNCGTDQVSDTPIQQTANSACPNFPKVSCSNGPNGDMFMNHMDYTYDICRTMFSVGQKNRMRALFNAGGARVSLLSSLGCVSPISANCPTPTNLTTTNITTTSARFNWNAASGANSYNIQGRRVGTANWTNLSSTTNYKQLGSVLQPCKNYEWQVQSVCNGGVSAYSSAVTFSSVCAQQAPAVSLEGDANSAQIAAMEIPATTNAMLIQPNPARQYFTVSFEAQHELTTYLNIYDLSGKQQLSIPLLANAGSNELQIDASQLAAACYVATLNNGNSLLTQKLVIAK